MPDFRSAEGLKKPQKSEKGNGMYRTQINAVALLLL